MKIVEVVNAMIEKNDRITNTHKLDKEIYFLYDKLYKWSISPDSGNKGEYWLYFYPKNNFTIDADPANIPKAFDESDFVIYRSNDIKTKEATESFNELYQIVSDKVYGIEDIFNKIIKG